MLVACKKAFGIRVAQVEQLVGFLILFCTAQKLMIVDTAP
jgi:hypothetical protein